MHKQAYWSQGLFSALYCFCLLSLVGVLHYCGIGRAVGSSVTDTTFVGQFVSSMGGVEGLSYRTATQQGLTNARGEFHYRAGEQVQFSIGATILGSAPADIRLSPFDLVGIKPPMAATETSATLRAIQQQPYKPTPFEVANNIATFLQTLDEDNQLNNGIRIPSQVHTVMQNSTVSFHRDKHDKFHTNPDVMHVLAHARVGGAWHGNKAIRHYALVLDDCYTGLGLIPKIVNIAQTQVRHNTVLNQIKVFNYDPAQRQQVTYFFPTTGELGRTVRMFNEQGLAIKLFSEWHRADKTMIQERMTAQYDLNGNLVKNLHEHFNPTTQQWLSHPSVALATSSRITPTDALNQSPMQNLTFSKPETKNQTVLTEATIDMNGDGKPELLTALLHYDLNGNLTESTLLGNGQMAHSIQHYKEVSHWFPPQLWVNHDASAHPHNALENAARLDCPLHLLPSNDARPC